MTEKQGFLIDYFCCRLKISIWFIFVLSAQTSRIGDSVAPLASFVLCFFARLDAELKRLCNFCVNIVERNINFDIKLLDNAGRHLSNLFVNLDEIQIDYESSFSIF